VAGCEAASLERDVATGRGVAVGSSGVAEGGGATPTATDWGVSVGAGEGVGEMDGAESSEAAGSGAVVGVGDGGMDVAGVVAVAGGVPVTPKMSVWVCSPAALTTRR
jgi:hypothetical protein